MSQPSRLRVLVSAYATSPAQGGEAAVGWNIARRLGRYHDVTVLYAVRDHKLEWGSEVTGYLQEHGPVPGVKFVAVEHPDSSRIYQALHEAGIWVVYYLGYRSWQKAACKVAEELHAIQPFDIAYQLNMIGYREPGFLWSMPLPFVWGPVGGASNLPWSFFGQLSLRGKLFYFMRNTVNRLQMTLGGRSRKAARRAAHVWAVDHSATKMFRRWGVSPETMLETGTAICEGARIRDPRAGSPLQICWSGNHIGLKCLPILLHALARFQREMRPRLKILGDGPETEGWKGIARQLGLDEIEWMGRLPHRQALDCMMQADVFAFSSVQEGTPHVVTEALSMGMPVICHDACGMGTAVTDACGIKVPLMDVENSICGFHDALTRMSLEPGLVARLSKGALLRAKELSWDSLVERIARKLDEIAEVQHPDGRTVVSLEGGR